MSLVITNAECEAYAQAWDEMLADEHQWCPCCGARPSERCGCEPVFDDGGTGVWHCGTEERRPGHVCGVHFTDWPTEGA